MASRRADAEVLRDTYLRLLLRAGRSAGADLPAESNDSDALINARTRLRIEGPQREAAVESSVRVADAELDSIAEAVARGIAVGAPRLLDGFSEIPREVGNILRRRRWGERLDRADEDLLEWTTLDEQPLHVQSVRVGFLRELVRAVLPDDLLDDLDTDWAELTLPVESGPLRGLAVTREVVRLLEGYGTPAPEFPAHVVPYIESAGGLYLSTAGVPFDPYAGYGLDFGGEAARRVPASYLASDLADYALAGGRGNQGGTYWGFVIRGGGVFSSIQLTLASHAYFDRGPDPSPRCASTIIEGFNRLLAPLQNRGRRNPTVGVLFSTYRPDAHVVTTERSAWIDAPETDDWLNLPRGWGYAMVVPRGERGSTFPASPPPGVSLEVEAAMEFLRIASEADARSDPS